MEYTKDEKKAIKYRTFLLGKMSRMFDRVIVGRGLREKFGDTYLEDMRKLIEYLEFEEGFSEYGSNDESMWEKKFGKTHVTVNLSLDGLTFEPLKMFHHRSLYVIVGITNFI